MSYRCSRVCFILLFFLVICITADVSTLIQNIVVIIELSVADDLQIQSSLSCTCAYVMKV